MLTVGSTFSGVGGIDLGFEQTGRFETVWMSEVDRHASAVLAHRWPTVPNLGDINEIGCAHVPMAEQRDERRLVSGRGATVGDFQTGGVVHPVIESDAGGVLASNRQGDTCDRCGNPVPRRVDVIAGGFPCQDYSVAGNRGGLAGDRGALWWQLHRLVDHVRPTWFVGENVPGLLSSNGGRDFRTIIESLGELGYACVWRVLDSQWFGVAQRRRRVVIVGHSGGRPRPEVLAVGQGLSGDSPPSRETGQDVAGTLAKGSPRGSFPNTDTALSGGVVAPGAWPSLALVAQGAFRWQENQNDVRLDDPTQPLTSSQTQAVLEPTVRRLTPLECERLQGFPDQWTQTGDYGDGPQPMSDTQRYRQMGNAVTVPVFRWVAQNIAHTHDQNTP